MSLVDRLPHPPEIGLATSATSATLPKKRTVSANSSVARGLRHAATLPRAGLLLPRPYRVADGLRHNNLVEAFGSGSQMSQFLRGSAHTEGERVVGQGPMALAQDTWRAGSDQSMRRVFPIVRGSLSGQSDRRPLRARSRRIRLPLALLRADAGTCRYGSAATRWGEFAMSGALSDLPSGNAAAPSPGAVRMARHRRRRKDGLRCLTIELRETEIDALVRGGRLATDQRGDRTAVTQALYKFLEDTLR